MEGDPSFGFIHSSTCTAADMNAATDYAFVLSRGLKKLTMSEFFTELRERFFPGHDASFMDFFLEMARHEDEFVVPASKLTEFGILAAAEQEAGRAKTALCGLGLVESEHFQEGELPGEIFLIPDAFKTCLMRARRRDGLAADPYALSAECRWLERIRLLFRDYERELARKRLERQECAAVSARIDKLSARMDKLFVKIDELLLVATRPNEKMDLLTRKVDVFFERVYRDADAA